MSDNRPIGIFDSGIGGLTVAKEIKKSLPLESIIYMGDCKHLPYGNKSKELIVEYSEKISSFLIENNCKAIVIACNSATANALNRVKYICKKNKVIVYNVITPVVDNIACSLNQKIGILATKTTISSHIYKRQIKKLNSELEVNEIASPLLVPIIEEGLINTEISKTVLRYYLSNNKFKNIDSLILGCTHYPFLYNEINNFFNKKVNIINSALILASHIKHDLRKKKKNSNLNSATYTFYVTELTKSFSKQAKKFFGSNIDLKLNDIFS